MRKLVAICAVILALGGASTAEEASRQIVVTGTGTAEATPDMATVSIGVQQEARTARAAMDAASVNMGAVMAKLDEAGIEPRDIQTTNIGLSPRFARTNDGSAPRVTGYIASNTLSVRVRDLDALGGVLDAVVSDGANALNGLTFGIADTAPLESAARAAAVADARAKAGELADAAGITLGPVMTMVEGSQGGVPQPMMRSAMMEAAMDVPVAAGELSIRQSVTVTYSIAD